MVRGMGSGWNVLVKPGVHFQLTGRNRRLPEFRWRSAPVVRVIVSPRLGLSSARDHKRFDAVVAVIGPAHL